MRSALPLTLAALALGCYALAGSAHPAAYPAAVLGPCLALAALALTLARLGWAKGWA
ncbi:hypothetical protein [Deinococcus murrayi]|uniref:hypothetical protein n=1 Tax=Deinococcus murrayi TaxID=68910 RepID=UPI000A747904|nr:hypothetical protein [Deinococcus murrayi]